MTFPSQLKMNRRRLKNFVAGGLLILFVSSASAALEQDIALCYAPSYATSLGGEANTQVALANIAASVNAIYDQCGAGAHWHIAGYYQSVNDPVNWTTTGGMVGWLSGNNANVSDVVSYGSSVGADLVEYIVQNSDNSTIAGVSQQPGMYSSINPASAWYAIFAHEIGGHAYGCNHQDGHINPKTIMMHNYCGGGSAPPYYFSNPNMWWNGTRMTGDGNTSCLGGSLVNGGDNTYCLSANSQGVQDRRPRPVVAPVLNNAVLHWCFTNAPGAAAAGTTNYDLISGAPAIVRGNGATYTGSALRIPGGTTGNVAMSAMSAYIDLPNGIISSQTSLTIEIWATPLSAPNWARIMDFGRTDLAGDGLGAAGEYTGAASDPVPGTTASYSDIMLSAAIGTAIGQQRFEAKLNGTAVTVNSALATTAGVQHHYAITFTDGAGVNGSAGGRWQWYRDGDAVGFLDVNYHLASLADVNNWLGRSLWSGDSNANNDYAEVRISNVAMSRGQILANYLVGPNYFPDVTLTGTDALGSTSFNAIGNWSSGVAPASGHKYETYDFTLRTPATTSPYTFAGDALTMSGGFILWKGTASSTITVNDFRLNNASLQNAGSGTFTLAGSLKITNDVTCNGINGPTTISANLSGNGSLTFYANTATLTGNNTNFTGKMRIGNGIIGNLVISSEAQLGGNPSTFTPDQLTLNRGWLYTTTTFTISNSNRGIQIGMNDGLINVAVGTTLTLGCPVTSPAFGSGVVGGVLLKQNSGTLTLSSPSNTHSGPIQIDAGTLSVSGAGTLTSGNYTSPFFLNNGTFDFSSTATQTISSPISGTGALTKNGSGTLTLSGANIYSGITSINGGRLLVNGSIGSSAVTASSGGMLGGNGTISGAITVQSGGTLSPGTGIGILTASNNVTFQTGSTNVMEISKSPLTNDQLRVTGALTFGGTLVVSNLSGSLAAGDKFKLFQAGSINNSFASYNLPTLTANLAWNTNNLSSGILSVVQTAPTNLVWQISNTNLNLSWPSSYTGWRLQVQTNALNAGLGTNWFDVAGASQTNNMTLPVDSTKGSVFYRLIFP